MNYNVVWPSFWKNVFTYFPHIIFFGENTEIVLPNLEDILIYVMLRKHLIFYIIYSGLIRQLIPNPSFSFLLVSLLGTRYGLVYFKTMRIIH